MPDTDPDPQDQVADPVFTPYGIGSAALGLLSVAAIVLGLIIASVHRDNDRERAHQSRVLATAVDWTGVLINMNTENLDASLRHLRDGTVGKLNVEFDSAVRPYREVVQKLKAHSTGAVEAVAIQGVRNDPEPGTPTTSPADQLPAGVASRIDTVLVVATSLAENAGGKPQTVHWNLRLDIAEVSGKLQICGLGSLR